MRYASPFQFQQLKKIKELVKVEKKLSQKSYPTNQNSLIVQALWQVHYYVLLIILEKECEYGLDNKKCEICGINYKKRENYLEPVNIKDDLIV